MIRRDNFRIFAVLSQLLLFGLFIIDYLTRTESRQDQDLLVLSFAAAGFGFSYWAADWERAGRILKVAPFATTAGLLSLAVVWTNADQSVGSSVALSLILAINSVGVGVIYGRGLPLAITALTGAGLLIASEQGWLATQSAAIWLGTPIVAILGELAVQTQPHLAQERLSAAKNLNRTLTEFRRPRSISDAATGIAKATERLLNPAYVTVVLAGPDMELVTAKGGTALDATTKKPDSKTAQLVVDAIGGAKPEVIDYDGNALLVCPIPSADRPAGAVVAYPFPQADPEFLTETASLFSIQIGMAIQHLYEFDALEKAARTDELTGLGNRKHANELVSALRGGDALILLDLDGFKAVNDSLGHPAGDQVLRDLSKHLQSCLRDSDTSARLGGDEFLVVAKRAFADPEAVARRILTGWNTPERNTTLSIGIALHDAEVEPQQTYKRADEALYEAKSAGKNQWQLWRADS